MPRQVGWNPFGRIRESTLAAVRGLQPEEADRIVVEDVPHLGGRQELRRLDPLDGQADALGPVHLIGAEHQAFAESGPHQGGEVLVELGARKKPVAGASCDAVLVALQAQVTGAVVMRGSPPA